VDDETPVRKLTIRALSEEGFICDPAVDGIEGTAAARAHHYDVIVTDLRMPNKHGHALVCDLLPLEDRPLLVVLTGVMEPRLVKDLINRGIDYIDFKPVEYDVFAATVSALAKRRRDQCVKSDPGGRSSTPKRERPVGQKVGASNTASEMAQDELAVKLSNIGKILPVSQTGFDVFNKASSEEFDAQHLAAAIAQDSSLSVDVLRLANSGFYNPSGGEVTELEEAAVRIGQKRIGELALAASSLAALTTSALPWMNVELAWRRSVAAGMAVELLVSKTGNQEVEQGLFLSAIMHSMGRIVLGMLYPRQYQEMALLCAERKETLLDHERRAFPLTHGEAMSRVLAAWKIPLSVHQPLQFVCGSYGTVAKLPDPLRTKVELVKLAAFVGNIAAGEWESWDMLEFPPAPVLRRLSVDSLSGVLESTRNDLREIESGRLQPKTEGKGMDGARTPGQRARQIAYLKLTAEPYDFLADVVSSMGIELLHRKKETLELGENVLVNCLWTPPFRLAAQSKECPGNGDRLIVTNDEGSDAYSRFGRVVVVPGSYGALHSACRDIELPGPASEMSSYHSDEPAGLHQWSG